MAYIGSVQFVSIKNCYQILIFPTFTLCWWLFQCKNGDQHLEMVTNISKFSPLQTVSNFRHQHRYGSDESHLLIGWQWCRWHRYVDDFMMMMMMMIHHWWPIWGVGGRIIMLATFSNVLNRSPTSIPTSYISNLSPTQFVSSIHHQHQCKPWLLTN